MSDKDLDLVNRDSNSMNNYIQRFEKQRTRVNAKAKK